MHSQVVSGGTGLAQVDCCRRPRELPPARGAAISNWIQPKSRASFGSSCDRPEPQLSTSTSSQGDRPRPLQPMVFIQSVLNGWLHTDSTAETSTASFPQWLLASILTSSLLFHAAPADALGFFQPVAENAAPITGYTISRKDMQDSEDFSARVAVAVDLLEKGKLAQARGDFSEALDCFEKVTQTAGDLALAEYARVGHAVTLYEIGDRSQAIVEMEDVSIALKGYPEIHAALAAALYVDKHAAMPAEKQFNIATLLDPRYTNLKWVQETKHWPPSLLNSLQKFISLQ